MIVVINFIMATISNLAGAFPLYVIPNYKIERKKVFLRLAVFGVTIGNIRYFFQSNSAVDVILIVVSNFIFFYILLSVLKPQYYKFVIAYGLYVFVSFGGESIIQFIWPGLDFNINAIDFLFAHSVFFLWGLFSYTILYSVLKRNEEKLDNMIVDMKCTLPIFMLTFFCTISPIYISRIMDRENVSSDAVAKLFVLVNIFTLIVLVIIVVRTITVRKKNYILEYNAARERESIKLSRLIEQNEYAAKLRHDYINQISVAKALAEDEPAKAIDMLDKMKVQYERG
ncbi:MAG: hypothetical protein ACI4EV_06305 [Lachnospiraceae bacterium]